MDSLHTWKDSDVLKLDFRDNLTRGLSSDLGAAAAYIQYIHVTALEMSLVLVLHQLMV